MASLPMRPPGADPTEAMLINSNATDLVSTNAPGLIALGLLIVLVIAKEITVSVPGRSARTIGRILDVGILPLLVVCAVVILTRIGR